MGAVKRFKDDYPTESENKPVQNNLEDKRMIEAYLKKIDELLNDPEKQKKAAQIISNLINNK
jgi:CRISPR/Cas system-associated exonuclease Cas4 (RecB family)